MHISCNQFVCCHSKSFLCPVISLFSPADVYIEAIFYLLQLTYFLLQMKPVEAIFFIKTALWEESFRWNLNFSYDKSR